MAWIDAERAAFHAITSGAGLERDGKGVEVVGLQRLVDNDKRHTEA